MINRNNLSKDELSKVNGGSMFKANFIYPCKDGDTIASVAKKYAVDEKTLMDINGITDANKDLTGMKIIIS